jgi:hypothetical protein
MISNYKFIPLLIIIHTTEKHVPTGSTLHREQQPRVVEQVDISRFVHFAGHKAKGQHRHDNGHGSQDVQRSF